MATHQEERAGANLSFWEATEEEPALHSLRENTSADVCIVGAGIAGLSIAYELSHIGQKVIVLDDGAIGRRYRRQDEAGTPFGITVDFETLGEKDAALLDTVTLRHRDSMKQERVKIGDLLQLLMARVS